LRSRDVRFFSWHEGDGKPRGAWADRILISHQGRWPSFADPNQSKFKMCSVCNARWHLVSEQDAAEPTWELFDLKVDCGEINDVSAENPEAVKELAAAFDTFWSEALPLVFNEQVVGPKINPFQELITNSLAADQPPTTWGKMGANNNPRRNGKKGATKSKKT
jgi:hypothetical protein